MSLGDRARFYVQALATIGVIVYFLAPVIRLFCIDEGLHESTLLLF